MRPGKKWSRGTTDSNHFGIMGTAWEWDADARTSRMDVLGTKTYVMVRVCVSRHSQQPLFTEPWWPCLGRVMINGHLPVIYLQEDGWSGTVWLEGGETRRVEAVGERDSGRKRVRSFLPWTLLWSWVSSEVRCTFKCVCASLFIYRALALALFIEEGNYSRQYTSRPCEWKHARAAPAVCQHTFQWETHTHTHTYQLDIISAAQANDCNERDWWSTQHTAH